VVPTSHQHPLPCLLTKHTAVRSVRGHFPQILSFPPPKGFYKVDVDINMNVFSWCNLASLIHCIPLFGEKSSRIFIFKLWFCWIKIMLVPNLLKSTAANIRVIHQCFRLNILLCWHLPWRIFSMKVKQHSGSDFSTGDLLTATGNVQLFGIALQHPSSSSTDLQSQYKKLWVVHGLQRNDCVRME